LGISPRRAQPVGLCELLSKAQPALGADQLSGETCFKVADGNYRLIAAFDFRGAIRALMGSVPESASLFEPPILFAFSMLLRLPQADPRAAAVLINELAPAASNAR
jgi:hypothetical protein